jgi:hypothetical protein
VVALASWLKVDVAVLVLLVARKVCYVLWSAGRHLCIYTYIYCMTRPLAHLSPDA